MRVCAAGVNRPDVFQRMGYYPPPPGAPETRSPDEKARLAERVEAVIWPWIAAGTVVSRIDRVFPLAQAAAAHARMEGGEHVGKIVLIVN